MAIFSTLFTTLVAAAALVAPAVAHNDSPQALARRAVQGVRARDSLAKCANKLRARDFVDRRLAKREQLVKRHLQKRNLHLRHDVVPKAPSNDSQVCILAPEVMVGPYYLADELIREDITEGQPGIELLLDFQFVDVNTCEPITNAYVDIWHCNSTGKYSGYEIEGTLGESYNRGLQPTDEDGIMHMITNVPGWYTGRATHIHIAAHTNGTVNTETSTYEGAVTHHIGQVYFPEEELEKIDVLAPYNTNALRRVRNTQDALFNQDSSLGYDGRAEIQYLGESIEDGIIAYISIGIDVTANHTEELHNPMANMPTDMPMPSGTGGFPGWPTTGFPSGFPTGIFPPGFPTSIPSPSPIPSPA